MKGTIYALISIALFSSYAIFGKILIETISPYILLLLNQTLAGIILILLLDLTKKIKEIKQTSKHDFKFLYLISIFSAVIAPLLFLIGLKFTSATNTILIGKSEAVLTSLLAFILLKDKITKNQIIGTIIVFIGIILIATKNFSAGLSFNIGDSLVFLSALSYACGTILFKKFMHHIPPEVIITLRNLFGASILFIISLFFVDYTKIISTISPNFILTLLASVILTTIIGQY